MDKNLIVSNNNGFFYVNKLKNIANILLVMLLSVILPRLVLSQEAQSQYEKLTRDGKKVYETYCIGCHGETGKGDGTSAATLEPDVWGHRQKPFNFTRGQLKGGPGVKDIYKTFMTGSNGTAMPSYADFFENPPPESPIQKQDIWHLISYILSLRVDETNYVQK